MTQWILGTVTTVAGNSNLAHEISVLKYVMIFSSIIGLLVIFILSFIYYYYKKRCSVTLQTAKYSLVNSVELEMNEYKKDNECFV